MGMGLRQPYDRQRRAHLLGRFDVAVPASTFSRALAGDLIQMITE